MEAQEYATAAARMLSQAMNVLALIENAEQGKAIDGPTLHRALGSLIGELTWLAAHRGPYQLEGLTWPPDMADRIDRLASQFQAWELSAPVPPGVLAAGAECLCFVRSQRGQK